MLHPIKLAHIALKAVDRKPGAVFRRAKAPLRMKYRDIEYTVVQGIERGVWKWTASVAGVVINGQAAIKSEAVTAAEKAIDRRSLRKKSCGLSRPKKTIDCGDAITSSDR